MIFKFQQLKYQCYKKHLRHLRYKTERCIYHLAPWVLNPGRLVGRHNNILWAEHSSLLATEQLLMVKNDWFILGVRCIKLDHLITAKKFP